MKFEITKTPLEGLIILEVACFEDERGFFMETWNKRDFAAVGLDFDFVQDNHSRSSYGVLRGLHYQDMTAPLGKLVRCTLGRIFDVGVDLRINSPTFGQWYGVELSAENKRQYYVPVGFAHAFITLSDIAEVQYKQTGFYAPDAEGVIIWNDADIGIDWLIADPILSPRDQRGISLKQYQEHPAFF